MGLQFPDELVLLGDKVYPNHGAVITPYTSAQLARKQPLERRKCMKLNSLIKLYRVRVEQLIGELKTYRSVSLLWRHPRTMLPSTVKSCAALVCRRKEIGLIIWTIDAKNLLLKLSTRNLSPVDKMSRHEQT